MAAFDLTVGDDVFPQTGQDTDADDLIRALGGADVVASGDGDDTIEGGDGDDVLKGGRGVDALYGDAGTDRLYGGAGGDSLNGGGDADTLWGQEGDDSLDGGAGNDVLVGGAGADAFIGGAGFDTVSYRYAVGALSVGVAGTFMLGEAEGDTFDGIERILLSDQADSFHGGTLALTVYGYGGADAMFGGDAAEALHGGDGDDDIRGGAGDDVLVGGAGDDLLYGEDGNDRLYGSGDLRGGDGADVVQASGGEARGGAGNDRLYLTAGAQLASGDDGADIIHANGSGAVLDGGAGYDTVSYREAVGGVSIAADGTGGGAASGDSWVSIERFWLSDGRDVVDFSAIGAPGQRLDIYGFDGEDWITGSAGRDRIDGGAGDDILAGGDGNDVLISRDAGESSDGLIGGAGDDVLVCGGFAQNAQGNAGSDLFLVEIGSLYTLISGYEFGTDRLDISGLVDAGATYTITYDGYYDVRYVNFSTGHQVGLFNIAAADLQALLDDAYGVSPPPPPGAPADPEGARFAEPERPFVLHHGEWLLG